MTCGEEKEGMCACGVCVRAQRAKSSAVGAGGRVT